MNEGKILIRDGTAVIDQNVSEFDILIENEKIKAVGNLKETDADDVIDASGMLVLPGGIDTHVHFDDEFMNTVSVHDYYKGTLAAAYGGTTSVIDFSNQIPGKPLIDTLLNKKNDAAGKAVIDYSVHPVISDPSDDILDEIQVLVEEGAPTFKCYLTYRKEGLLIENDELIKITEKLKKAGGMLMVHAEDNDSLELIIPELLDAGKTSAFYHAVSRPSTVEDMAIENVLQVIRKTKARLFVVHLASGNGMKILAAARAEGLDVLAETCIHYLVFTEDILKRDDGIKWICSPALRSKTIQDELWRGVNDGRISMVTSDDAAFSWDAKLMGKDSFDRCPNGIAGIEPRFVILYSEGVAGGRITLPKFVDLISTNPAKIFGMYPQKGTLLPGADADIVILDPGEEWIMGYDTLHMGTDYSAYENIEITGKIRKVFSRGELIIDGDRCLAEKGRGRFIFRKLDQ